MSALKTFHQFPRDKNIAASSNTIMAHVMIALIPGALLSIIFYGVGTVVQITIGILVAICCEWLVARARKRPLGSLELITGLLTATLLALSIPPIAPYYVIIWGTACAILLGKHVYGGVGMNIFNPAMVGFCAVYLSFPADINLYPIHMLGFSDTFDIIFREHQLIDMITGATPLSSLKANGVSYYDNNNHIWLNSAWLIGGVYLWVRNFSDWRLSITFISVFCIATAIFSPLSEFRVSFGQHIGLGAVIFTACFIITDPTSAATSTRGRIIYAVLCAVLAVIIRQLSNLPDSMAFAILLANCCVPLIDGFTRPEFYRGK